MLQSVVTDICIGVAKQPLQSVSSVMAMTGQGLKGDRYGEGTGSYQKGMLGNRQVTLIDSRHLKKLGWTLAESRRNIAIEGDIDLMRLLSVREHIVFQIGQAIMRGVDYCDPCRVPTNLSEHSDLFRDTFWGIGGLIAEVIEGGEIHVSDRVEVQLPKR